MKILFLLGHSGNGGLEKYYSKLSQKLKSNGLEIETIFLNDLEESSCNLLFRKIRVRIAIFKKIKLIKPDKIVSFQNGMFLIALFPALILRKSIILSERTGPSLYFLSKSRRKRYILWLIYLLSEKIVIQFESYKNTYPSFLSRKLITIPNFIPSQEIQMKVKRKPHTFQIGYFGRLSPEKNLDILIMAFKLFSINDTNAKLWILGNGPDYSKLSEKVKKNSLTSRVYFTGYLDDPREIVMQMDLTVAISSWEGFPNSVAESLSLGIPVLGNSHCEGVRDLVIDGINGWLIDSNLSPGNVAEGLNRAQRDLLTSNFSNNCIESVSAYTEDFVINQWKILFES